MWDIIRSLVAGGTTLLLTTQYLDEADELADEIVVIDHGLVIAAGTAEELKSRVGGDVLEFTVPDRNRISDAVDRDRQRRRGRAARRQGDRRGERRRRRPRSDALVEAVRAPGRGGRADPAALALRRPSLDDVFLALTGHAAEEDDSPASAAAGRRSAKRRRHEGGVMTTATAPPTALPDDAEPAGPVPLGGQRHARPSPGATCWCGRGCPPTWCSRSIQPVMFVLLFRYVFGGAIHVPGRSAT